MQIGIGDTVEEFTLPLANGESVTFASVGDQIQFLGVMEGYRAREKNKHVMELNRSWQKVIQEQLGDSVRYLVVKNFGHIPGMFHGMGKRKLSDEPYPVAIDTDGVVTGRLLGDAPFRLIGVNPQGIVFTVLAGEPTAPKIERLLQGAPGEYSKP